MCRMDIHLKTLSDRHWLALMPVSIPRERHNLGFISERRAVIGFAALRF